jgi:hypothetical protein
MSHQTVGGKIMYFVKQNKLFLLLCLLILPSFINLVQPGLYSMHDDIQAFRFQQMDKCFQDLQIPCRWIPDMGYQYGYPQFNFYPPSPYYVGTLIAQLGVQFIDVTKIMFGLGFVVGGLGMYLFMKSWLGKWPAFVAAVLYTYAPYKAANVYVRGAMSEYWAMSFYPFIFWSIYQFIKTRQKKYGVFLSLSVGGLIMTHNLMPLIFLPLAAMWGLIWLILEKRIKLIGWLLAFGVLGITLAGFFIFPVIVERPYVHLETIIGGYFDYRMHFASLYQLFVSNYWGYGSSVWGPWDGMSLSTGQIHALFALVAVVLALVQFKKHPKVSVVTLMLFGLALFVLFMIHQKSSFIWDKLPFLAYLQFPWRFLSDSVFLLSVLGGIAIFYAEDVRLKIFGKIKAEYILGIIVIVGVMVLHMPFFQGHDWKKISDQEKFSGTSWNKQLTISIFDYLPIFAELPPIHPAPASPEVLEGRAEVKNWYKGSDWQHGWISSDSESLIRLPLFDFPGMTVTTKTDDGNLKKVDHWNNDCRGQEFCLGLITFKLPSGNNEVNVHLDNTWARTVGNISTLVSVLILGLAGISIWRNKSDV